LTAEEAILYATLNVTAFLSAFLLVRHGWEPFWRFERRLEQRFDQLLNQQLLMEVSPRAVVGLTAMALGFVGVLGWMLTGSFIGFILGAAAASAIPHLTITHLEAKRRRRLETQIVDGVTSLASGVRAGLNLVQSIQLLVRNGSGPIKQEFQQIMREYDLGIDLNQSMHSASERIGSSYYRLLFAAIAAHRERGGDMGQSLDRIADSIREIQRLEGRLDAITAQGRAQARFMGVMPIVVFVILYAIMPEDTSRLLTQPTGRLILLLASSMVAVGFVWIRRIMAVDI
jgi:tight adherence protein B